MSSKAARNTTLAIGSAIALAGAGALALPAQAATVPSLTSSTPKTVVMDPSNGHIISVVAGSPATAPSPKITNQNFCYAGNGCYYSGQVPWANQGFEGSSGTFQGQWPYRDAWYTGIYTASACWVGACSSQYVGPNTTVTFGGALVTGTSFSIK